MEGATVLETDSWVVVDLETTGLSPQAGHEIIEIGAIRLEGPYLNGQFHSLINPGRPIPGAAQAIHGISDRMVVDSPPLEEILHRFLRFSQGAMLISHNAPFDRRFLDHGSLRVMGMSLPHRHLDTLRLSRKLLPRLHRHGLDHLVTHLGIRAFETGPGTGDRHRALGDAQATAEVWMRLKAMAQEARFSLETCFLK